MAYILPNFFPTIIHLRDSPPFPLSKPSYSFSYPHTKLDPPPARVAQLNQSPQVHDNKHSQKDDLYVNLGLAVRTLRQDLPLLFTKDLNYHIYRDDITFVDPLNTFTGIEKYKMIFWALRFHGRILFREISMEVLRIWQPSENMILIRWNLRGVPRVPWEAKGHFQGTSRYKLDRTGKIYQHKVDKFPATTKTSSFCYGFGCRLPCYSKSYIFVGSCGCVFVFLAGTLSSSQRNFR